MSRFSFSLRDADVPAAAIDIGGRRISAARVERHGGQLAVTGHATETLPEGALVPSLTGANVRDRDAVMGALTRALEQVGRPRRVGLIVPDPVVKVSLVKFEQVPAKERELEELLRWQVRKSAPFPLEEAQLSFVPGADADDGHEFVVSCARRDVILEYENLCAAAGAHAGIVDLSTFNVINTVLASHASRSMSDWLLVNVAADWASIAVLRGSNIILFRSRGADGEGTLADLVHQTSMYYEDRLNGSGFRAVMISGTSNFGGSADGVNTLRDDLEGRLGTQVSVVDTRAVATFADRITPSAALIDALAPLVGMLARQREDAA
jgi:Tfp pilus assembly PilM family ATPase